MQEGPRLSCPHVPGFPVLMSPVFISILNKITYHLMTETFLLLQPPLLCASQAWTKRGDSAVAKEAQPYITSETDNPLRQARPWPTPECWHPHLAS